MGDAGRRELVRASPGHIDFVRRTVIDSLDREQLGQLTAIASAITRKLDPEGKYAALPREE